MDGALKLTDTAGSPPATDDELSQYAADCAAADVEKCGSCFAGPAMADCSSFLCMRDVGKLLARLDLLRVERDELREKWQAASRDLAALREQIAKISGSSGPALG